MSNALQIIYYIFNKFIDLLFNQFTMFNNVSIGWVLVSILIMSIMISNILSVAKNANSYSSGRTEDRKILRENKKAQTTWYNNHM